MIRLLAVQKFGTGSIAFANFKLHCRSWGYGYS